MPRLIESPSSIGLHSLAVSVPERVLTNEHWREHYPREVDAERERLRATVSPAGTPDAGTPETGNLETGNPEAGNPEAGNPEAGGRQRDLYHADPFGGVRERRVLSADGSAGELEARVAREAIAAAGAEVGELDLLICASAMPDHHGIGSATYLARELSLTGAAWNLESAGASPMIGLQTACSLIATGQFRKALVVTSCTYSQGASESEAVAWRVGDAATAMVVGPVAEGFGCLGAHSIHTGDSPAIWPQRLAEDAEGKLGYRLSRHPESENALTRTIEQTLEECSDRALEQAGLSLAEVDRFVFSMPGPPQIAQVASVLEIDPRQILSVYPCYAETGPARLGLELFHAAHWKQFRPGELVLLYAVDHAANSSAMVLRWGEVALGALPVGSSLQRLETFQAEAFARYHLDRLEVEVLVPARATTDADRRLHRLVSGYAALAVDEPSMMTLFAEGGTNNHLPQALRDRSQRFVTLLRDTLGDVFDQQGRVADVDPGVAAVSLLGIVHWGVCAHRAEERLSHDEAIDQVTQLALHGLLSQPPKSRPSWPLTA